MPARLLASELFPTLTRVESATLEGLSRELTMRRALAVAFERGGAFPEWRGRCQWCRKVRPLQWAHVEPLQTARHLAFDPDNTLALCVACHLFRWHRSPRLAEEFVVRMLGQDRREALAARAEQRRPIVFTVAKGALVQALAGIPAAS